MPAPQKRFEAAESSDEGSDSGPDEHFRHPVPRAARDAAGASDSSGSEENASFNDDVESDAQSGSSGSDVEDAGEAGLTFEERAAQLASGGTAGLNGRRNGALQPRQRASGGGEAGEAGDKGKRKKPAHRENKNRPMEASSKRRTGRFRDVLQAPKPVVKDPRFEDLSGKYVAERFRKQYDFLYQEALPQEKSSLKAALKKVKNPEKKAELKAQAARLEQSLKEDAVAQKKRKWEAELKAKEREAVKAGKKPFYLKKSEKRKLELLRKYEDLQASGGLENYMAKRRRKNAAKDHRYVPASRRAD